MFMQIKKASANDKQAEAFLYLLIYILFYSYFAFFWKNRG